MDPHLVVAQRGTELLGDGGHQLGEVELAEQAARDFPKDGQLGHPQRLFRLLAPSLLLEVACLAREGAHLVHQRGELIARAHLGLPPRQRAPHRLLQVLAAEGLDQVLEGPVGQRVLHRLQGRVGRDHHDLDAGVDALDAAEELDAVHLRHLDVHEDQVRVEALQRTQRRFTAIGGGDVVPGLEDHAERFPRPHLVVHHEDARAVRHATLPGTPGSTAVKATSARPCLASSRPP